MRGSAIKSVLRIVCIVWLVSRGFIEDGCGRSTISFLWDEGSWRIESVQNGTCVSALDDVD